MNRPLFSIVFLVGAVLAAVFFTWPALQDLKFLQMEKRSKLADFENREEYFTNIRNLTVQLKNFEPELGKLDHALPEDTFLPSLYQLVQEVASSSGVVLKSIASSVQKGESPVKTIDLQLKVAGVYESLKSFLENSQNAWRLLSIDSVSFVSPKTGSSFEVSFRMQAHSY
ncbi:MAG: hypothetical protein Greene071421_450 [Parcubacteria group bacterium Greene0714_21]|nr:MAG: hypothetical protein Greene041639_103 [Parcubacteria group bacterium Greene0416_39]TSC98215.1 MAG: hypothetical protein Greene101447_178 [Parcubacteria group bacterium Greene1014_47]TSD04084.1 MAG: hypothetical protein Greene071421_450 [Parcubacteria group bacterium Greene0714_21]